MWLWFFFFYLLDSCTCGECPSSIPRCVKRSDHNHWQWCCVSPRRCSHSLGTGSQHILEHNSWRVSSGYPFSLYTNPAVVETASDKKRCTLQPAEHHAALCCVGLPCSCKGTDWLLKVQWKPPHHYKLQHYKLYCQSTGLKMKQFR